MSNETKPNSVELGADELSSVSGGVTIKAGDNIIVEVNPGGQPIQGIDGGPIKHGQLQD